ncbi:MAG: PD40 domain-containing protein [Planctomycetes bacterium]|nr:PD40 domain-containing protein [Planctomycetota bacterium]
MKLYYRLMIAGILACSFLCGGCLDNVTDVFTKPLDKTPSRQQGQTARVPEHLESDPVQPGEKRQMGIQYDPEVFEQGAYRPDQLRNMISSKGFDGLAQQTFAEAGGDFDVDIDFSGTLMAYASTRYKKTSDICLQSVKGSAVTLHTSDPADDMMPKFSPNGRELAWCSNRYGNWDILISPTNRTARTRPQQLTRSTEDDLHPSWSPDAYWAADPEQAVGLIAFARYSAMDAAWRIWVMDIKTRTPSAITEGIYPEFNPIIETMDDQTVYTILYQKHRQRDIPWFSVWMIKITMNADGAVELANSPTEIIANDKWAAINPSWSPDGRYIAFAAVRKSPMAQWESRIYRADDIWIVKVDGTDLTQITAHSAPDWSPVWARDPDPKNKVGRLYFNSLRNGYENIWSVSPIVAGMTE